MNAPAQIYRLNAFVKLPPRGGPPRVSVPTNGGCDLICIKREWGMFL